MSVWERLKNWFRSLFRPTEEAQPPPSFRPRVLLIIFNPTIAAAGERKLTQSLGWGNADELCREYIADLRECSNGFVEYEIVERMEVDAWPVKVDGFRYDATTFLRCWRNQTGFHKPDNVDYEAIIAEFDLLKRVESGQIDEVWLFGFPYAGFWESTMVGPGAFFCNSDPVPFRGGVSRRFLIMGFNYERGVGEMLESFGHRVESIMRRVWRHEHGEDNLWERFILYDKKAPGKANCGWMHYAPNSVADYGWGNRTKVLSNCDDWLSFPSFQGIVRPVDCSEWGNGDIRAHHKWWFKHLPHAEGQTLGISNNWWWYAVDLTAIG